MKKTILKFIIWLAIIYVGGFLFMREEVYEWEFFRMAIFVLLIHFLIFSESNMKKLKEILRVPEKEKKT